MRASHLPTNHDAGCRDGVFGRGLYTPRPNDRQPLHAMADYLSSQQIFIKLASEQSCFHRFQDMGNALFHR